MLCYFCLQKIGPEDVCHQHHPNKALFPDWTEPAHGVCHIEYHKKCDHFKQWGAQSPYRGIEGLRLAVAAYPGFHRMGGLARARSAKRGPNGCFIGG